MNKIVTIAKMIPLLLFLVLVIFAFEPDVFMGDPWDGSEEGSYSDLFMKATAPDHRVRVPGIEGASNYSPFAGKRYDIGKATEMGSPGGVFALSAWTLMSAEVLSIAAKNDDMPAFLPRETPDRCRPMPC